MPILTSDSPQHDKMFLPGSYSDNTQSGFDLDVF
jgi:hypothetical protein